MLLNSRLFDYIFKISCIFAATVHTTLQVSYRNSASQGVSFALINIHKISALLSTHNFSTLAGLIIFSMLNKEAFTIEAQI